MSPTTALWPPVTRTSPVGRAVAPCSARAVPIDPVGAHLPVPGSYSSAEPRRTPALPVPPITRTWPVGSTVAVCEARATVIEPVGDHFPVGEYSSAEGGVLPALSVPPV